MSNKQFVPYAPKYFRLTEFIQSMTAKANDIDNTPSFEVVFNLSRLCQLVLDPIRQEYGKSIRITSGYRCKALNVLVGGVSSSQHLSGLAADLQAADLNTVANLIAKNPNVDQMLFEHKNGKQWLHVSIAASNKTPRNQILFNYKAK